MNHPMCYPGLSNVPIVRLRPNAQRDTKGSRLRNPFLPNSVPQYGLPFAPNGGPFPMQGPPQTMFGPPVPASRGPPAFYQRHPSGYMHEPLCASFAPSRVPMCRIPRSMNQGFCSVCLRVGGHECLCWHCHGQAEDIGHYAQHYRPPGIGLTKRKWQWPDSYSQEYLPNSGSDPAFEQAYARDYTRRNLNKRGGYGNDVSNPPLAPENHKHSRRQRKPHGASKSQPLLPRDQRSEISFDLYWDRAHITVKNCN
ncbi:hypothetical protein F5B21DRAFT_326688 [Xylaria acuta]|nr:hypothetical protein F5B21DRAFT_326688 [Xylaria acuta]